MQALGGANEHLTGTDSEAQARTVKRGGGRGQRKAGADSERRARMAKCEREPGTDNRGGTLLEHCHLHSNARTGTRFVSTSSTAQCEVPLRVIARKNKAVFVRRGGRRRLGGWRPKGGAVLVAAGCVVQCAAAQRVDVGGPVSCRCLSSSVGSLTQTVFERCCNSFDRRRIKDVAVPRQPPQTKSNRTILTKNV